MIYPARPALLHRYVRKIFRRDRKVRSDRRRRIEIVDKRDHHVILFVAGGRSVQVGAETFGYIVLIGAQRILLPADSDRKRPYFRLLRRYLASAVYESRAEIGYRGVARVKRIYREIRQYRSRIIVFARHGHGSAVRHVHVVIVNVSIIGIRREQFLGGARNAVRIDVESGLEGFSAVSLRR